MPIKKDQTLPRGIYKLDPNSKMHHIRYTDALGRTRREKAGSLRMAEDLLVKRQIDVLRYKIPGHRNRVGIRMSELIDDAINHAFANNDPTAARDLQLKFNRIKADFGDKQVALVTRDDISRWLDEQTAARSWKPSSRNRYQSAFSLMFRLGIEAKKVEENIAAGIPKKQEASGRIRFLSRDEEMRLTEVISQRYPAYLPVFILSLHTGMRLSEQLRSQVGDYNAETGVLEVRQTKNRRGPTVRHVPLTPLAVKAYEELSAGKEKGQPLCVNTLNAAMTATRYWFNASMEEAAIDGYTWHDNRHSFCSRLVMGGVPIAAVSQLAGHSNIAMTMRYSHLCPNQSRLAVEKMMAFYA